MRARLRNLAIFALAAAAACAPAPPPAPPEPRPEPVILDEAGIDAIAAILRMEDRREFAAARLAAFLADPGPEIRRRAALAAGRIADPAAVPLLLRALADSSAAVRADAAFALGELADTSAAVIDALAALLEPPDSVPVDVAREAVAALGKLATPSARAAVLALLDATAPPALHGEALLAVWRFPRTEAMAERVLPFLRSPDPELRWRAAYALMRIADPRSVPALRAALIDPEHRVREFAARALRAPLVDSAGAADLARAVLAAVVQDSHPHVRINAVRALATYRSPAVAHTIAPFLADADANVAIAAAQALGDLGGAAASEALDLVVRDDSARLALRGAALASLARTAPSRGIDRAAAFAASPDWLVRFYAARALAAAPWNVALPTLRRLQHDRDPRVAAAAMESILAAGDSAAAAYPLYLDGLASADPMVRAAALRGIARRPDPADLPHIFTAYERSLRDTLNDATLAAVDALGALAAAGVPVARSFFLRFPRSDDPVVRDLVARRLGTGAWGPPRPFDIPRDAGFYHDVVRDLVAPALAGEPLPRVRITTASGVIILELAAADAPLTVRNFLDLVRDGFFAGTRWHRVVPNFVLQDGDPRGDGSGGPGYAIRDEMTRIRYDRGVLGMALAGPDTGGSQFFITLSPQPHLDGGYTAFGRVIDGMDVADRVVQDDPILEISLVP